MEYPVSGNGAIDIRHLHQTNRQIMNSQSKALSCLLFAGVLAACGGGDSPRAKADAAEALARSLIQTGPCSADSQCGFVTFQTPFLSCSQGEHAPLLLTSESAPAVAAAAADQRRFALEALALESPPPFACPAVVEPPPIAVCVQTICTLKPGSFLTTPPP